MAVAVLPNGRQVISGGDNTVKVWDLSDGRLLQSFEGHTAWVTTVAVTPDCTQVLSGSSDSTIKVWEMATGRILRLLEGGVGAVSTLTLTPDGKQVIAGSIKGKEFVQKPGLLGVWDLDSGQLLRSQEGHEAEVTSVVVTPDGRQFVSSSKSTDYQGVGTDQWPPATLAERA